MKISLPGNPAKRRKRGRKLREKNKFAHVGKRKRRKGTDLFLKSVFLFRPNAINFQNVILNCIRIIKDIPQILFFLDSSTIDNDIQRKFSDIIA